MNFQQFLTILLARKKIALIVLSVTVLTTLVVSLVMPKSYKATTTLIIDYKGTDPVSGVTLPAQLMPGYMATQVNIITSRNVALKVVDTLGLAHNPAAIEDFNNDTGGVGDIREWLVDALSKKLDVTPSRESSAIDLSYQNEDPKFAATLANAFADAYIQTNLQLKIDPSRRAAVWFSEQVQSLRDNLVKAQDKLSAYQRDKGIVSVDERMDVENARLAELSSQLVVAQAQTFDSSSKQKEMYSGKRLDQLSKDVSSSRQRESSIRAALDEQKARVLKIKQQRDQLNILQGDVVNAQKVLDLSMQRFSQTNMEGQANQSGVAVLDRATPPMKPYRPKLWLNLLISIFLGSMLAVGFALLAEMLNRCIHMPEDLSLGLGLPVLGGDADLILHKQKELGLRFGDAAVKLGLVTEDDIRFALSQQFDYPCLPADSDAVDQEVVAAFRPYDSEVETLRALRSQIALRWSAKHKFMVITAPTAGQGASRLAANLAVVFSQQGERTLLIDADMRNPRQHKLFRLQSSLGLSDILAGRANAKMIQSIQGLSNLSVLPAGTEPANPFELFGRRALSELINEVSGQFDVILIDTPPALECADAQTLSARTGGALIVARRHHARIADIEEVKQKLAMAGAEAVGVVLTDF